MWQTAFYPKVQWFTIKKPRYSAVSSFRKIHSIRKVCQFLIRYFFTMCVHFQRRASARKGFKFLKHFKKGPVWPVNVPIKKGYLDTLNLALTVDASGMEPIWQIFRHEQTKYPISKNGWHLRHLFFKLSVVLISEFTKIRHLIRHHNPPPEFQTFEILPFSDFASTVCQLLENSVLITLKLL